MAGKELTKILGSKNILENLKILEEYSKDLSFAPRIRPRCVETLRHQVNKAVT